MTTKTEQDKPVSFPSLTEGELTQFVAQFVDDWTKTYNQGFNHALELVLLAKELGLTDEEIIKRYKK